MDNALQLAGQAYKRHDWVGALEAYRAARGALAPGTDLAGEDLWALSNCLWWLGMLHEALQEQQAAYRAFLDEGLPRRAALVALDAGYTLFLRGQDAAGSGWMNRAVRLLSDEPDCAEQGYLIYVEFESAREAQDLERAEALALEVQQYGDRFGEPALVALGLLGQGQILVERGEVARGMALLDEAMLLAVSDDLDPGWAGNIYCGIMMTCSRLSDLRRASEWTQATARWCEAMPGAGPFMGICRVHRAEVLQALGKWDEAERDLLHVCDELADFFVAMVAEAHYRLGDLKRQRGDLRGAEEAFGAAHELGRDPQPGLALLRLQQGRVEPAVASIRGALVARAGDALARSHLLPAVVEIEIAAGNLDEALEASTELDETAARYRTTGLEVSAMHARGAVLLARGDAEAALPVLRSALAGWRRLRAPYEAARVRTLLARAYMAIGDRESAALEAGAAELEFQRLGAGFPSAQPVSKVAQRPGGLTEREAEILAMVAEGMTNQQIASELVLSVRTVERHLATVYQKLGLSGRSARAAAVSYALREGLATPRGDVLTT